MPNKLWIAKSKYQGEDLYLPHCVKKTRAALSDAILNRATQDGFVGTIDDLLEYLDWQLVEIEFTEAPGVKLIGPTAGV